MEGLVLESRYPQLQYIIKGPIQDSWRDGIPIRTPKHIVLEFDRHLLEMDQLVREKELTDEDKEYIRRQLEYEFSKPNFPDFWEHKPPRLGPPWPTYDETDPKQIPNVAKAIGLVTEALRYEKQRDEPRQVVIEKLEGLNVEE